MSQNVSTKVVCRRFVTCCVLLCVLSSAPIAGAKLLDFSDCVIVAPGSLSRVEQKAVRRFRKGQASHRRQQRTGRRTKP
jgi:hypothetical protein